MEKGGENLRRKVYSQGNVIWCDKHCPDNENLFFLDHKRFSITVTFLSYGTKINV